MLSILLHERIVLLLLLLKQSYPSKDITCRDAHISDCSARKCIYLERSFSLRELFSRSRYDCIVPQRCLGESGKVGSSVSETGRIQRPRKHVALLGKTELGFILPSLLPCYFRAKKTATTRTAMLSSQGGTNLDEHIRNSMVNETSRSI